MSEREHIREEQVIPYLDRRLEAGERADVERHLGACTECRTRLDELRAVMEVLGEWPAVEASAGFTAAVRARLEAEAQPAARVPMHRDWRWVYAGGLGVAAVVLLVVAFWGPVPPTTTPAGGRGQTAAVTGEEATDELATTEPVLLEDYELLRDFDVLFETQTQKEPGSGKRGT